MTDNIYWTIVATIKDGQLEKLKSAIEPMVDATRTEKGALSYDFWLSDDLKKVYVFECYQNSDAVLAHMENVGGLLGAFFECVDLEPLVILGDCSQALKETFAAFGASHVTALNSL